MYGSKRPRTRLSAVAVLDVLGFSALMRAAHANATSNALLRKVIRTFSSWYGVVRDPGGTLRGAAPFWELKAFTDNVVIGMPVPPHADEQTLVHALDAVATLQRGLALEGGFFTRGGVAFGDLYMDDDVVFGIGLLDAHCVSESVAVTPRAVLHASAASLVPRHARRYGIARSPHFRLLLRDEDGELFVNYLAGVVDQDGIANYHWLARHKDLITNGFRSTRDNSRVRAKYEWLARFHNYVCSNVPDSDRVRLPHFADLGAKVIDAT